jgi:hypothetical protein
MKLFLVIYLALASFIGFIANRLASKETKTGSRVRFRVRYAIAIVVWVLPFLCAKAGVFAIWRPMNFIAMLASIPAYLYFSFASFSLRPRTVGIVAGSLLTASVFITMVVFPFSLLGIMFIVNDIAQGYQVTRMSNGFVCQSQVTGSAFTETDQTFELLRPILGAFYQRVGQSSYSLNESQGSSNERECPALLEEWSSRKRAE